MCVLVLLGRRLLSAPLINNLAESGSAEAPAAVSGSNVAAAPCDLPSPALSAAEALELESVTFGQDAADLLDKNASAGGRS